MNFPALKLTIATLAVCSLVSGITGAWYWWRSSKVLVMPFYIQNGEFEPFDPNQSAMQWIVAHMMTFEKAGDLNKVAAIWTAISVSLSSLSALMSLLV